MVHTKNILLSATVLLGLTGQGLCAPTNALATCHGDANSVTLDRGFFELHPRTDAIEKLRRGELFDGRDADDEYLDDEELAAETDDSDELLLDQRSPRRRPASNTNPGQPSDNPRRGGWRNQPIGLNRGDPDEDWARLQEAANETEANQQQNQTPPTVLP